MNPLFSLSSDMLYHWPTKVSQTKVSVFVSYYFYPMVAKHFFYIALTELMVDTPPRCILLLEDIDAAFVKRSNPVADNNSNLTVGPASQTIVTNVTFSGLLNAIDGVAGES
jgi:hypothetical protein